MSLDKVVVIKSPGYPHKNYERNTIYTCVKGEYNIDNKNHVNTIDDNKDKDICINSKNSSLQGVFNKINVYKTISFNINTIANDNQTFKCFHN
uniref:Uncharacterized protein n=1 Tax=Magallana gigas TaxID=29159 RepID=K1QIA0_MAGGI